LAAKWLGIPGSGKYISKTTTPATRLAIKKSKPTWDRSSKFLFVPLSANPKRENLLQSQYYARDYGSYLAEADELRSNREQAEHELRRYEQLYISTLSRVRT